MTDEAEYQPLPMPHGRVRPSPPPLLVEEGRLPQELVEQARARHAEAEVLVLPREPEAHLQDEDPSLAIYAEGVSAAGVIGIASYLVGRIRKARQSGSEPKLEVNLARPDGTLLHIIATDADAGVKALAETLAATVTDPAAREKLLRIATGADPSTALPAPTPKSQATAVDGESEASDQYDTPEGK